ARASAWHAGAQIVLLAALAAVLVVAAPLGLTRLKEPGSLRGDCAFGNWVLNNPLTRRKYNGKPFSRVSAWYSGSRFSIGGNPDQPSMPSIASGRGIGTAG